MRHQKPFRKLWLFFLFVTIPSVILLLCLHIFSVNTLKKNQRSIIAGSEQIIVSNIESTCAHVSKTVNSNIASMDFVAFCDSRTLLRINRYASSLTGKLRDSLGEHAEVAGFVLYNSACDRLCYTDLSGEDPDVYSQMTFGPYLQAGERIYDLRIAEFGKKLYIVFFCAQRYGSLAVLLDPEQNEYYQSYVRSSDSTHPLRFQRTDPACSAQDDAVATDFTDLPLQLIMTGMDLSCWSRPPQILILLLILLILSLILAVGQAMQSQLIEPLGVLWGAFQRIGQGETDYRILQNPKLREIDDFYQGFNQMLDRVQVARTQKEQSELQAAHARLQFYQLQIRPHFYLNCLKNIRAMASIHEDDKIQEMVILMSEYLRYIFQDNRNFISLQEELEAVQGYVDLIRIMGTPIELICDINTDGLGDPALPMSVLTFVENSVKHNRNQRTLTIRITSQAFLSKEGEPYQRITIRDDGEGFTKEMLEELNSADPTQLQYRKYHIGIANVRYRLWLVYGDDAEVCFRNEGSDAVVQVCFPAKPGSPETRLSNRTEDGED